MPSHLHSRGHGFYPPSGGASRAFGLPPAAAKRILRAEARTHFCPKLSGVLKHRTAEQESALVTAVPALCAVFEAEVGQCP